MNCRSILSFVAAAAAALTWFAVSSPSQERAQQTRVAWKIAIPGSRPLATPAVAGGRVYVGGGFGSHEFYALDAATGARLWTYKTADDGPTAAVVSGDKILFNTESCELETITTNGKPLWKKWLGDPLMSMPAVADGTVYMAYPNSRGDHRYSLAAFDLESGKEEWKHPIAGEIITAPVIEGGRVYAATVDGSLYSFDRRNGSELWHEAKNATSAPAVWNEQCFFSRREQTMLAEGGKKVVQQNEVVAVRSLAPAAPVVDMARTMQKADYLDYAKRKLSRAEAASQSLDATVGFGGTSKGSANMLAVSGNLGQASVHGVWAYQGSKPFVDKGRLFSSMGDKVMSVDPKTEKVIWTRTLHEGSAELLNSEVTPPAIVNGRIFVGTRSGEVFALSEATGEVLWKVNIGEPVEFQPAVSGGHLYVPTSRGSLLCLTTGDKRDDGWLMWGANGAHNGLH